MKQELLLRVRVPMIPVAAHVIGHMRRNRIGIIQGNIVALVVAVWPRLKRHKREEHKGRLWKETTPDADNTAKLVFDALNGVAYADDKTVVSMTCQTLFAADGEEACVEIYLWKAPEFP